MSSPFAFAHACASAHGPGEDRVAVLDREGALIVVVADGAGGVVGGARAAELLVQLVSEAVAAPSFDVQRAEAWTELLVRADLALEADPPAGETTAVVVAISERGQVTGASSGDSGAWVVDVGERVDDLTAHQSRYPPAGSRTTSRWCSRAPRGGCSSQNLRATQWPGMYSWRLRTTIQRGPMNS